MLFVEVASFFNYLHQAQLFVVLSLSFAGWPPKVGQYLPVLLNETLNKSRAKKILIKRMVKMIGYKMGLYYEDIGLWEPYKSAEFDLNHYR